MATSNSGLRACLEAAFVQSIDHLENLDRRPVAAIASIDTLRQRLGKPFADDGIAPDQVIEELLGDVADGIVGSASGRYFAGVIGGALPSALAADWLASAWDQNAVLYATGPAAAIGEEAIGAWLKEIFGLPEGASFAVVTGCQMAHATCLAAACAKVLQRPTMKVSNVRRGSSGDPPSDSCVAETAPAAPRASIPLDRNARGSRSAAGGSAGLPLAGAPRSTEERTISSTREKPRSSACQHASTRSA